MFNSLEAKNKYQFYDATEKEDSIIRQVIAGVQCTNLELGINLGASLLTAIVSALLFKSFFNGGMNFTLVAVSIALPAVFIYRTYKSYIKRLDSSGILATKDKQQHYLICRTTCSAKKFENRKYLITCKTHNGRTIENVLVTHGVYNYLTILENVSVCIPDSETPYPCVGIPSQYFERFKDNVDKKEAILEIKRDLREGEKELILEQYADRVKLRNQLFIRNNLILLGISLAVAILGYIKQSNGPLYLGAVATVLFVGTMISPFVEDKKFIQKVNDPETPKKILEATVSHIDEKANEVSFNIPSVKEPIYISKKPEVRKDFKLGTSALLLYIAEEQPVPFRKFKK